MKLKLLLILVLLNYSSVFSQEDKTVTLMVSAQGQTISEAKQNALRDAIEQAFGAFISSNTEILNDELVKDEIVSVSNGNIQDYDVISELELPEGGYATTLKATVSVTKLTSFVESKGGIVEFKGGLFASNILIQELYEKNETEAISNIVTLLKEISKKSFDHSIKVEEPFADNNEWIIPITVDVFVNNNFFIITNLLEQTLRSLSLSEAEVENYKKLNKKVYPITLATTKKRKGMGIYYLRMNESRIKIQNIIFFLKNAIIDFKINNGLFKKRLTDYNVKKPKVFPDPHSGRYEVINAIKIYDSFKVIAKRFGNDIMGKSLFESLSSNQYLPELMYRKQYEIDDIYCSNTRTGPGVGYKQFRLFYNFKPLKKIMFSNHNNNFYGLVISFADVNLNTPIIKFNFSERMSINQIKQISTYEIIKN